MFKEDLALKTYNDWYAIKPNEITLRMWIGLLLQWKSPLRLPGTQPQTFTLIKVHFGSCYLFVPHNCLLHSLYVQTVGHKDSDIIGVHGYLCHKRASKRNPVQSWTCLPIPKLTDEGFQSEDIQKMRQRTTLLDQPFVRESPWVLPVHLHHCLQVVVHHANLFESNGLQNSYQKPMVNPIEGLGLIQIDQHGFGAIFWPL